MERFIRSVNNFANVSTLIVVWVSKYVFILYCLDRTFRSERAYGSESMVRTSHSSCMDRAVDFGLSHSLYVDRAVHMGAVFQNLDWKIENRCLLGNSKIVKWTYPQLPCAGNPKSDKKQNISNIAANLEYQNLRSKIRYENILGFIWRVGDALGRL